MVTRVRIYNISWARYISRSALADNPQFVHKVLFILAPDVNDEPSDKLCKLETVVYTFLIQECLSRSNLSKRSKKH